jgi:hypothetical protein
MDRKKRKKGEVRTGHGTMCNVCGLNCGKGGALRSHLQAAHNLTYEQYKESYYRHGQVINNSWKETVAIDNEGLATYTHTLVRNFTRQRSKRGAPKSASPS